MMMLNIIYAIALTTATPQMTITNPTTNSIWTGSDVVEITWTYNDKTQAEYNFKLLDESQNFISTISNTTDALSQKLQYTVQNNLQGRYIVQAIKDDGTKVNSSVFSIQSTPNNVIKISLLVLLIIIGGALFVFLLVICVCCRICKRRRKQATWRKLNQRHGSNAKQSRKQSYAPRSNPHF